MTEVADEFRRKAEACRRLADLSPEADRKSHWVGQACEWDQFAAQALKLSRRKQRSISSQQTSAIRRNI
jgi:hypothetical protein